MKGKRKMTIEILNLETKNKGFIFKVKAITMLNHCFCYTDSKGEESNIDLNKFLVKVKGE